MTCTHETSVTVTPPRASGCEECLASGGRWKHLRLCLSCGHVGCCDSSPGKHARAHSRTAGDPIVASFEPGERWAWCFVDETDVPLPAAVLPYLR